MDIDEYLRTHVPRCIAGFAAEHVAYPPVDTHDGSTVFRVRCTCGQDRLFIEGFDWRNPDYGNESVFVGPISLRCSACGAVKVAINTDIHGYDSELGHGSCTVSGEGEQKQFACPTCGPGPLAVLARFDYPTDIFVEPDFVEYAGRFQDLFDWYWLYAECGWCNQVLDVTNFECA
ncbi:MAG: hypothetical protein H6817_02880 [Phycisphaerales bacterium]|nr:hypothetical protein [Phycisphaerales bacterium]